MPVKMLNKKTTKKKTNLYKGSFGSPGQGRANDSFKIYDPGNLEKRDFKTDEKNGEHRKKKNG